MADPREPGSGDPSFPVTEEAIATRAAELRQAVEAGTDVDWAREYWILLEKHEWLAGRLAKIVAISDRYQASYRELVERLEDTNARFRQLRELGLPVCTGCRKAQTDGRYWARLEEFLQRNTDLVFAKPLCQDCLEQRYGTATSLPASTPRGDPPSVQLPAVEDEALRSARTALSIPSPRDLMAPFTQLANRYEKLLRRLNKVVRISDRVQADLREVNLLLEHTSRTDPLTSLANRRAMRELLAAEVSRARRHGSPLVVVSLDLDHFKAINDTYGHDAGDAVLVQVAAVMERNLRREDSCGRWGGEEFLMVLPECGLEASTKVAEKLRGRIEQATVILGGRTLRVTASIGVATFSVDDSVEDLLRRADDAMYAAKRGGRNRVVRL